jgi:hypothetical protein
LPSAETIGIVAAVELGFGDAGVGNRFCVHFCISAMWRRDIK